MDKPLILSDRMVEIPIQKKEPERWCQCEHACHFDGGTGHPYGEHNDGTLIFSLQTSHGKFDVCRSCYTHCHGRA